MIQSLVLMSHLNDVRKVLPGAMGDWMARRDQDGRPIKKWPMQKIVKMADRKIAG